jgi:hypothetical protein
VLVYLMFPKYEDERRLLASYHEQDTAAAAAREDVGTLAPSPAGP